MSVKAYAMGKKHALHGVSYLAHRLGKPYDSKKANQSYKNGYAVGAFEREAERKRLISLQTDAINKANQKT